LLKLFGTDGVRGIANKGLTPELAFKLGQAGSTFLCRGGKGVLAIGRDTRLSGTMLHGAMTAGICSAGYDVLDLGVVPTPVVAWLVKRLNADGGVVISASHNPAEYNGIKFFDANGVKLSEDQEKEIEDLLDGSAMERPTGIGVGAVSDRSEAIRLYDNHVCSGSPGQMGLRVAIDCANGAAFEIAPRILRRLGVDVTAINIKPDGVNINYECGSTHIDGLAKLVRDDGYDIGLAFDGDADRVLVVDENGLLIDGDHIMAICAEHRHKAGQLNPPAICVTVMTNIGFDLAMRDLGIEVVKTKVGDRYVLQEMLGDKINIGGEQSGHVIFLDRNTTGDGLITAIEVLRVMYETGKPISELARVMTSFPQVLRNLRAEGVKHIAESPEVLEVIAQGRRELGDRGRVLVRPSGTEPLIRVMVESDNQEKADQIAGSICEAIEALLDISARRPARQFWCRGLRDSSIAGMIPPASWSFPTTAALSGSGGKATWLICNRPSTFPA
jgi:phosphoglucosamine mutase